MSCVELAAPVSDACTAERRRATLSTRLSRLYFGMSLILVIIGCSVLYVGISATLSATDFQILEKRLLTLRDVIDDSGTTETDIYHEVSEDLEGPRRVYMRIITDNPDIAVSTPEMPSDLRPELFPKMQKGSDGKVHQGVIEGSGGRYFRAVSIRVQLPARWGALPVILQVAVDTSRDELILGWLRQILAFVICLAAVLCWISAHYLVRRELRPLQQITKAASLIESKNFSYRLQRSNLPAELDELAEQFNQMLERLQSAYGRMRHYADEVAHELRSPINKMLLGTEVILRQNRTNEEYQESLELNLEDCQNLALLVDQLLFLARAENTHMQISRSRALLIDEFEVLQDFFRVAAEGKQIELAISCSPALSVMVDRVLFRRAMSNLLANAIEHTPHRGRISLSASACDDSVSIVIADTGEGIPLASQPHIFDRFYMVEKSRHSTGKRVGLGLAITKSIISLHGGSISVSSSPGRGTSVCVSLPHEATSTAARVMEMVVA